MIHTLNKNDWFVNVEINGNIVPIKLDIGALKLILCVPVSLSTCQRIRFSLEFNL